MDAQENQTFTAHADSERPILQDGLFEITQKKLRPAGAKVTSPRNTSPNTKNPLILSTWSVSSTWIIRRQPGIERSFTIGAITDPPTIDSRHWAVYATDESVDYSLSTYDTIWIIECSGSTIVKDDQGEPCLTYLNCSVREAGTNNYWTVIDDGNDGDIKLVELTGQELSSNQLFEFVGKGREPPPGRGPAATIYSLVPLSVTADSDESVKMLYFGTNKLGTSDLDHLWQLWLVTEASDQGRTDDTEHAESTWFELAIFSKLPMEGKQVTPEQIKLSSTGEPLAWESHRLPRRKDQSRRTLEGRRFSRDHAIFKSLQPGDYIGVLACARYKDSRCNIGSAKLVLCEGSEGKV
ncbi:unnamed protein product [Rhizoctonia solani]|uniref:Uncharacterized protein n=1 Tax=Rhizoctonia solani TaxID=456999 RepID=A0A8H3BGL2_9AGAM|nr:unnamed protein product [Rhizoctonia solani]